MGGLFEKMRKTFGRNISVTKGYKVANSDYPNFDYWRCGADSGLDTIKDRPNSRESAIKLFAMSEYGVNPDELMLDVELQSKASDEFISFISKRPLAKTDDPEQRKSILSDYAQMFSKGTKRIMQSAIPKFQMSKDGKLICDKRRIDFYRDLYIDATQIEKDLRDKPEYVDSYGAQALEEKLEVCFVSSLVMNNMKLVSDYYEAGKSGQSLNLCDVAASSYMLRLIGTSIEGKTYEQMSALYDGNEYGSVYEILKMVCQKHLATEQDEITKFIKGEIEFPWTDEVYDLIGEKYPDWESDLRNPQAKRKEAASAAVKTTPPAKVADSRAFLEVEAALDGLNDELEEDVSKESLAKVLAAQKKLLGACKKYLEEEDRGLTGKDKQEYATVKSIYEMALSESFRDVSLSMYEGKKVSWKSIVGDIRIKHFDITGKGTVRVGEIGTVRTLIPVEGERREIFTPDTTFFGTQHDITKVMGTVEKYLMAINDPGLTKFGSEDFDRVFVAAAGQKTSIEMTDEFFAGKTGYSEEDRRNVCAVFDVMNGVYKFDKGEASMIAPGDELGCRNVANSRLADLLGKPELVAKTVMAVCKDGDRVIRGTSMAYASGIDIRRRNMAELLKASEVKSFDSPEYMSDITALEVMDFIAGQIHRHPGKMFYKLSEPLKMPAERKILGVQAIDSEISFGMLDPTDPRLAIPSVIDKKTEAAISHLTKESLTYMYEDILSPKVIDAAWKRVAFLQTKISKGEIAVTDVWTPEKIALAAKDKYPAMVSAEFGHPEALYGRPGDTLEEQADTKAFRDEYEQARKEKGDSLQVGTYKYVLTAVEGELRYHMHSSRYIAVRQCVEEINECSFRDATPENMREYLDCRRKLISACQEYQKKYGTRFGQRLHSGLKLVDALLKTAESEDIRDYSESDLKSVAPGTKVSDIVGQTRHLVVDLDGKTTSTAEGNASRRIVFDGPNGKKMYFSDDTLIRSKNDSARKILRDMLEKGKFSDEEVKVFEDPQNVTKLCRVMSDVLGIDAAFGDLLVAFSDSYEHGSLSLLNDPGNPAMKEVWHGILKKVGAEVDNSTAIRLEGGGIVGASIADRNVASSRFAEMLGLGNLLAKSYKTSVVIDGKKIEGTAMEQSDGVDSRGNDAEALSDLGEVADMENPYFIKQIMALKCMDMMANQQDRHPGNIHYILSKPTAAGKRSIVGLQGIDNDRAFGTSLLDPVKRIGQHNIALSDLQYVDAQLAMNIMSMDKKSLDYMMADVLPKEEIDALYKRIEQTAKAIKEGAEKGTVKIIYDWRTDLSAEDKKKIAAIDFMRDITEEVKTTPHITEAAARERDKVLAGRQQARAEADAKRADKLKQRHAGFDLTL